MRLLAGPGGPRPADGVRSLRSIARSIEAAQELGSPERRGTSSCRCRHAAQPRPVTLTAEKLSELIFGTERFRRFTQDSPVMPDVWIAYRPRSGRAV